MGGSGRKGREGVEERKGRKKEGRRKGKGRGGSGGRVLLETFPSPWHWQWVTKYGKIRTPYECSFIRDTYTLTFLSSNPCWSPLLNLQRRQWYVLVTKRCTVVHPPVACHSAALLSSLILFHPTVFMLFTCILHGKWSFYRSWNCNIVKFQACIYLSVCTVNRVTAEVRTHAKTSRTIGRSSVSPVSARTPVAIRSSHASRVTSTGFTTSLPEIRRTMQRVPSCK